MSSGAIRARNPEGADPTPTESARPRHPDERDAAPAREPGEGAARGARRGAVRTASKTDERGRACSAGALIVAASTQRRMPSSGRLADDADREARDDQPDHQRVVVTAADEVEQHERIADAQPHRARRILARGLRQLRERDRDQHDAGDLEQAQDHDRRDDAVARDPDRAVREPQEQRPVRRRGREPRVTHGREEFRRAERGRTVRIRTDVALDHQPVGRVAVEVATEDRGPDEQRRGPDAGDLEQRLELGATAQAADRARSTRRARGPDRAVIVSAPITVAAVPFGMSVRMPRSTEEPVGPVGPDGHTRDGDQHHPDRAGRAQGNRGASRPLARARSGAIGSSTAAATRLIMVHRPCELPAGSPRRPVRSSRAVSGDDVAEGPGAVHLREGVGDRVLAEHEVQDRRVLELHRLDRGRGLDARRSRDDADRLEIGRGGRVLEGRAPASRARRRP